MKSKKAIELLNKRLQVLEQITMLHNPLEKQQRLKEQILSLDYDYENNAKKMVLSGYTNNQETDYFLFETKSDRILYYYINEEFTVEVDLMNKAYSILSEIKKIIQEI